MPHFLIHQLDNTKPLTNKAILLQKDSDDGHIIEELSAIVKVKLKLMKRIYCEIENEKLKYNLQT
jgi:hypothetical protein